MRASHQVFFHCYISPCRSMHCVLREGCVEAGTLDLLLQWEPACHSRESSPMVKLKRSLYNVKENTTVTAMCLQMQEHMYL